MCITIKKVGGLIHVVFEEAYRIEVVGIKNGGCGNGGMEENSGYEAVNLAMEAGGDRKERWRGRQVRM